MKKIFLGIGLMSCYLFTATGALAAVPDNVVIPIDQIEMQEAIDDFNNQTALYNSVLANYQNAAAMETINEIESNLNFIKQEVIVEIETAKNNNQPERVAALEEYLKRITDTQYTFQNIYSEQISGIEQISDTNVEILNKIQDSLSDIVGDIDGAGGQ